MRVHLAVHVHELAQEPVSVSQRLTSGKKRKRGELIGLTAAGGSDNNVLVSVSTSGTFGWGHGDLGSSVSPAYARRCVKAVEERLKSAHPSAQIEIEWRHVSSSLDLLRFKKYAKKNADPTSKRFALYFLWPTTFDENSSQTASYCGGFVDADALFGLMKTNEELGCLTLFPHPHNLYRSIVSKSWLVECAALRTVPIVPTVALKRRVVLSGDEGQYAVADATGDFPETQRWIVKLGYSWEALDVRRCPRSGILACARDLLLQPGNKAQFVYVQPFLESLCEFRVFIVGGKIVHDYFAGYKKTMPDGTFADFAAMSDNDVDEALQAKTKSASSNHLRQKGHELASKWLAYLQRRQPHLPAVRVDFLVTVRDEQAARLTTLEITECGFSMWVSSNFLFHLFFFKIST